MIRAENLESQQEAMLAGLDGLQARMYTALPGIIVSADLDAQTCSVQPSIQGVITDQQNEPHLVNLPVLVNVPFCWPRAGGFALTLPLAPGDEVLVVFSSRAIDSWWQSGGIGAPVEARMHDLSDGIAIIGPTSQPKKLANVQTDGIELRTESRDTYIKLTAGKIFIKGDIEHEGNTEQTGDFEQTGNVSMGSGGSVTMAANITHTGTITSNGKNIGSTHTHPTGGPNTGAPNP